MCDCWSVCTEAEASLFLRQIPKTVDSTRDPHSPWLGYLHHVYGGTLPTVVELSGFNFFYHSTPEWPTAVAWPMASCRETSVPGTWQTNQRVLCADEVCARWRRQPGDGDGQERAARRRTLSMSVHLDTVLLARVVPGPNTTCGQIY